MCNQEIPRTAGVRPDRTLRIRDDCKRKRSQTGGQRYGQKVEDAFREELDIHSPSRVMMSLGRFASVGVVKGLSSVDVKKYAEKQAGSLAADLFRHGCGGRKRQRVAFGRNESNQYADQLASGINDDRTA